MNDPIINTFAALATGLILAWCFVARPTVARCPDGWYAEGIRPSGSFSCKRAPIGDTYRDARGFLRDNSVQPAGELDGHIWCSAPSSPRLLDDGRSLACR